MGYFDHVDDKIEKIQEVGDIERLAGISFWYSVGAVGILLHTIILCSLFSWQNLFTAIPCLASITFCIIGLVYSIKSTKASKKVRAKNELSTMARAYNILWLLLSLVCIAVNTGFSVYVLVQNM